MTGCRFWRSLLLVSVVVPCYNEAPGLLAFHARLIAAMVATEHWTVLYVDDGSDDSTREIIDALREQDERVGVVGLSRNFGKEAATTAGIDAARGDAVVIIDADLQDPPEVIPALIEAWGLGFDMVYAQRRERRGDRLVQAGDGSGVLSADGPYRTRAPAAECGRFQADEPPGCRCRGAAAGAAPVHEGAVRLGGLSHLCRALRPGATPCRQVQVELLAAVEPGLGGGDQLHHPAADAGDVWRGW